MAVSVFILEDDDAFLDILSIRLHTWHPDVKLSIARTIAQGRSILEGCATEFQLAILDQHLPDGRGTELLSHPRLERSAILAMSADTIPELPADTVRAGAQHFLGKRQIAEPLFLPLIDALIERKELEQELLRVLISKERMQAIKVLLDTLRHEINNPLGAVFGGSYLLRSLGSLDAKQEEALALIDGSSTRIKHVIEQLCQTAELEEVTKADVKVFQVPGDQIWETVKR